jgi:hypothetical protein
MSTPVTSFAGLASRIFRRECRNSPLNFSTKIILENGPFEQPGSSAKKPLKQGIL